MLSASARKTLIDLVRQSLLAAVREEKFAPFDPGSEELSAKCGCFVTYKTRGELRGCIGCFSSDKPLWQTVAQYAALSVTDDTRFTHNRLTEKDLPKIHIDISVLSPLQPCQDPYAIELGVHGIYLRKGWQSGCFLPQVATETGWSVEEFWGYCCSHKAGLRADAWKTGAVELFTFTAEVIEATAVG
jgi:AmmeMemoRadiSam system protein A